MFFVIMEPYILGPTATHATRARVGQSRLVLRPYYIYTLLKGLAYAVVGLVAS